MCEEPLRDVGGEQCQRDILLDSDYLVVFQVASASRELPASRDRVLQSGPGHTIVEHASATMGKTDFSILEAREVKLDVTVLGFRCSATFSSWRRCKSHCSGMCEPTVPKRRRPRQRVLVGRWRFLLLPREGDGACNGIGVVCY